MSNKGIYIYIITFRDVNFMCFFKTFILQIRKPHFGLVVLSALYKNTDDPAMRGYLAACHRLATIPEVRL